VWGSVKYSITDNGPIAWFLGFQIKRDRNRRTILINQHAYIDGLLEKFQLTNAKPVSTPMDPFTQYSVDQCPSTPNQMAQMSGVPFIEAIGSVLWFPGPISHMPSGFYHSLCRIQHMYTGMH